MLIIFTSAKLALTMQECELAPKGGFQKTEAELILFAKRPVIYI